MNYISIFNKGFESYYDAFLASLKAHGPASPDDTLTIVCSTYEPHLNREYLEQFQPFFDKVSLYESSLVPLAPDDVIEDYCNQIISMRCRQFKLGGLACYLPYGFVPSVDNWSRTLHANYLAGDSEFYGTFSPSPVMRRNDIEPPYMSGVFVCPGSFFGECPNIRRHTKGAHFMVSARHVTSHRSKDAGDSLPFVMFTALPEQSEGSTEGTEGGDGDANAEAEKPVAKKVAKKAAKKSAKKKVAKKKVAKKVAKAEPTATPPAVSADTDTNPSN